MARPAPPRFYIMDPAINAGLKLLFRSSDVLSKVADSIQFALLVVAWEEVARVFVSLLF